MWPGYSGGHVDLVTRRDPSMRYLFWRPVCGNRGQRHHVRGTHGTLRVAIEVLALSPQHFSRLSVQANDCERVLSVRAFEFKEIGLGLVARMENRFIFDNCFDRSP